MLCILCALLPCTAFADDWLRLEVDSVAPARGLLGGSQHHGRSPHPGPARPQTLWMRTLPTEGALTDGLPSIPPGMYASPIQGPDGTIYAVALGGVLTAWSSDGVLRWQQPLRGHVLGTPSLDASGALLAVATFEGRLLCLDASTGRILWFHDLNAEVRASPVIDGQHLFISAFDQTFAFDLNGKLLWLYQSQDRTFNSTPAVSRDGQSVYVGSWSGVLTALDTHTGQRRWDHIFSRKQSITQPCIDDADRIFVLGSPSGDAPSSLLFARPLAGQGFVFPSLGPGGEVLAADQDGRIYGIDADGTELFEFQSAESSFRGSLVTDALGRMFAFSVDGVLWVLAPDGVPLSSHRLIAGGRATPLIGRPEHLTSRRLYLAVGQQWLIALEDQPTQTPR
jgi:outer membrane protein assembly factor BamB